MYKIDEEKIKTLRQPYILDGNKNKAYSIQAIKTIIDFKMSDRTIQLKVKRNPEDFRNLIYISKQKNGLRLRPFFYLEKLDEAINILNDVVSTSR